MTELDTLVKEYGRLVTAISFRMIENRELAEDAVQEAWLEIIKSLPSFENKSKISTWIFTIANRTVQKYAKNEKKYSVEFLSDFLSGEEIPYHPESTTSDEIVWTKEKCNQCITGSIHCLSNHDRLIYLLYFVAGMKYPEIAELLSLNEATIRKRISRSREKLHSFLNNQCLLYNPDGNCKCRMSAHVKNIDLQFEFKKLRSDIEELSFFRQCDEILSENEIFFRELCHKYNFSPTH